jgi:hypothetical protein
MGTQPHPGGVAYRLHTRPPLAGRVTSMYCNNVPALSYPTALQTRPRTLVPLAPIKQGRQTACRSVVPTGVGGCRGPPPESSPTFVKYPNVSDPQMFRVIQL